jgi:hypothetical protein
MIRLHEIVLSLPALAWSRLRRKFSSKTFVSEHFIPEAAEMKKVIVAMESDTRVHGEGGMSVKICRLCTKGNKDDMGNHWKLLLRRDGSYYCHRCSKGGNYMDLKKKTLGTGGHVELLYAKDSLGDIVTTAKSKMPLMIPSTLPLFGQPGDSPNEANAAKVLDFLNVVRGLKNVVLMRYGVAMAMEKFINDTGHWEDKLCVTFPWLRAKGEHKAGEDPPMETVRIKYRSAAFQLPIMLSMPLLHSD